ncbi:MAG: flagellar hook basal-body protein [Planctomycetes bacterium]|nr:flagellar hook basal-body protein [Planctomycetota bacterium]
MEAAYGITQNGLSASVWRLSVHADNIANMTTPGFQTQRVDQATFSVPGTQIARTGPSFQQGDLTPSERSLDLAIDGDGFFIIQTEGEDAYTRVGRFYVDRDGQLVTANGRLVQPSIVVPEDASSVEVRSDGIVYAVYDDGTNEELGELEIARFRNPSGLLPIGDSIYREGPNSGNPQTGQPEDVGFGTIRSRMLEASNVRPEDEIVQTIVTQRAFQLNARVFQVVDHVVGTAIDTFR